MKNNVAGWIIKKSNQSSIVTYNESNCTYKGSGGWYLSFAVNWEDEKQVCRRLTAVVLIQGEQEEVRETETQKLQWLDTLDTKQNSKFIEYANIKYRQKVFRI